MGLQRRKSPQKIYPAKYNRAVNRR